MRYPRYALALAGLSLAWGCAADIGGPTTAVERDDLQATFFRASIDDGLTETLVFDIAPGTESFLIEVEGERGLYTLEELISPSGIDLVSEAGFVTRWRGNYGLNNWLYPNVPEIQAEPGTYSMVIRGSKTLDGGSVSEDISVRIYDKHENQEGKCGLEIDFLIDEDALALADIEEALERVVVETDRLMAQAGVHVVNYSLVRVKLSTLDVNVAEDSVLPVVDDVLRQAREQGYARDGSMHVMMVRSIGGTSEPKGRSLGLPGPYNADRPNSAVLVATEHFVDLQGYLDTDGVAETLTHEFGHYMGLFHTSESTREKHDPITDTPECTSDFCGASFNENLMSTGTTSRRFDLTEGQATVMRRHPLCVPLSMTDYVPPPPFPECNLECESPGTCVIWGGIPRCLDACDPELADLEQCDSFCTTSDDGVFVCQPTANGPDDPE